MGSWSCAVSPGIQELEHEFGVTLFERGARRSADGDRPAPSGARQDHQQRGAARLGEITQLRDDTAGTLQPYMSTVLHIAWQDGAELAACSQDAMRNTMRATQARAA